MENLETIRVVIVDDEKFIRRALRTYLSQAEDIIVVGEGGNGEDALSLARQHRPDVILMDIQMPEMDGPAAVREIVAKMPEIRVLMVTGHVTEDHLKSAILAGAGGYIVKDAEPDEIVAAVREIYSGGSPIDPAVTQHLIAEVRLGRPVAPAAANIQLTKREMDVLKHLCDGMSNGEIAGTLYLSESSVKQYLSGICRKFSVRDRLQLVVQALRSGICA